MAVLLTRPRPDNEASAARLRARGVDVLLAPMLRFEPVAFVDDPGVHYDAVIATSSNALRAIAAQLAQSRLTELPLFAVGDHTGSTARELGFTKVISAAGDVAALRERLLQSRPAKELQEKSRLLYLAGVDISRDLAGELREHGLDVVTRTTYRMAALSTLPHEVCEAFAANAVQAVLHYSQRTAAAFLEAARTEGIEISALSVPQCCISGNVATVLREAGARQVSVAASPNENALFEALDRALRSRLA
ncbi:uroporphyrinogen-III synthase [Bradyrhizobium sp. STM 3562]|uniref:uroporphyrinogen-III synthase n=1 Tax=Bradyrhizobium sp. STM 3562 TaxID=578924 RepID=UPI003890728C